MKLNTLSLRWIDSTAGEGREVEVLVDGKNLIELVREWEAVHTPEPRIAGAYMGIHGYAADLLDLWVIPQQEKTTLLICDDCGEPGCWPLQAHIVRRGEMLVWDSFEQPHRRGKWSYDGFGPFVFEAAQYDEQVHALLRAAKG